MFPLSSDRNSKGNGETENLRKGIGESGKRRIGERKILPFVLRFSGSPALRFALSVSASA